MGAEWFGTNVVIPKRYTKHGLTAETFSSIRQDAYFFIGSILNLQEHYSFFSDHIDSEDLDDWYLIGAVDDFTSGEFTHYGIATVKNHFVYYTGGMSWGDSPTDCMDLFCTMSDLFYAMDKLWLKRKKKK